MLSNVVDIEHKTQLLRCALIIKSIELKRILFTSSAAISCPSDDMYVSLNN